MQMKKAKECGLGEKSGGKENTCTVESKAQASERDHCPTSPAPTTEDQVPAPLSSPQPPKEGGYCHCGIP